MKSLSVGDFKTQLSDIIVKVRQGESFEVVYGKKKTPVAHLVPINGSKPKKKRKLGIMDGKIKIVFAENFKMTDEELLDLRG